MKETKIVAAGRGEWEAIEAAYEAAWQRCNGEHGDRDRPDGETDKLATALDGALRLVIFTPAPDAAALCRKIDLLYRADLIDKNDPQEDVVKAVLDEAKAFITR